MKRATAIKELKFRRSLITVSEEYKDLLDTAIAAMEAWDSVLADVRELNCKGTYQAGVKDCIDVIKEYKKGLDYGRGGKDGNF